MKPEHTPTPWRIYKELMNPNPRIMAEASTLVAVISHGVAFAKETDANAAFIVKAVNAHTQLLKLAVFILKQGYHSGHRMGEKCGSDCVWIIAREITKEVKS